MDYSTHRTYMLRPCIMAIAMIVAGILTMQFRYSASDVGLSQAVRIISGFSLILFGSLILLPRFNNIMSAVGLMCFGIGLSRFLVAISYSSTGDYFYVYQNTFHNVILILVYIMMLFSAYMMYVGFNFMRMDSMNAFIMRFSSMSVVIGYTIAFIYAYEFAGIGFSTLWTHGRQFILTPILYIFYFLLLCSKDVYDRMSWEAVRRDILQVVDRLNPGPLGVYSMNLEKFRNAYENNVGWICTPCNPVIEKELRLDVKSENDSLQILIEKRKNDDNLYYALIPSDDDPYIGAQRGIIKEIKFEKNYTLIYNLDNLAFRLDTLEENISIKSLMDIISQFDESDEEREIAGGADYEYHQ